MVIVSMTLTDPEPSFQGRGIFEVEYVKNGAFLGTKLPKNTNRKPYTVYLMVQLSMTLSDLWPEFQGHDIFEVECRKNGAS